MPGFRDALKIYEVKKPSAAEKSPVIEGIALVEKRGRLHVTSSVIGAPVFLNGVDTNLKTPAEIVLAEGAYEVGVTVNGEMIVKKVNMSDEGFLPLKF